MTGWMPLTRMLAVVMLAGLAVKPGAASAEAGFSFDCGTVTETSSEPPAYVQDVAVAVGRKWNMGVADPDVMKSRITLRVCFAADGSPDRMILLAAEGPTEDSVTRLHEVAERAVRRAYADGGLPLPPDQYDSWRVLDLVFDANGTR
jgi:hypothetical protein